MLHTPMITENIVQVGSSQGLATAIEEHRTQSRLSTF